jgi:hypothetical protein
MIRYECFEWMAPLITDQLIVTSLSANESNGDSSRNTKETCYWGPWEMP